MADLKDRVTRLKTRSERELERIESEGRARPAATKKKKKKKAKPEAAGVGRDFSNQTADRLTLRLRERMESATDPAVKADLKSRIKALEETRL